VGVSDSRAVHLTGIVAAQGRLAIKVGDEVIGAAGVSGSPGGDKDEACVKPGLGKVTDQLKYNRYPLRSSPWPPAGHAGSIVFASLACSFTPLRAQAR